MHFIARQGGGVRQGLTNVLGFQIGQLANDFRGCHPVGDEIHDVRHGDARAHGSPPARPGPSDPA